MWHLSLWFDFTATRPAQKVIVAKSKLMQEKAFWQYTVGRTDSSHVNEAKSHSICSDLYLNKNRKDCVTLHAIESTVRNYM